MPAKTAHGPSRQFAGAPPETAEPSTGSVAAVVRAMDLLSAFALDEPELTLVELSRRVGLHKTTVLRLARTLAMCGYMVQCDSGGWRLGPAAGWLGVRYQSAFDILNVVEPLLRELVRETGESAAFYVREGSVRCCVARVDGPHPYAEHARMGEALPLDRGSPGRVILAFCGEPGEPYETIRKLGYHATKGERVKDVATVSAPIFGLHWKLLGSVCISGPVTRVTDRRLKSFATLVISAANRLSYRLAGGRTGDTPPSVSRWHP
ncbi:helix-turn-helix domain-containing protein [Xylophilus rhododendri]|uniref:Helix-turn-helix domain-containing protein n=1 Tax=Xylophilus rhododendri TaxID=2697032 RepID=A0A857J6N7_9BURK|nr:IclR family transcriptional regulator [Xylophilus rhododendri]QHI99670.1 helix-turn-helix domain-containing protein [Xylophilus rhododendri]